MRLSALSVLAFLAACDEPTDTAHDHSSHSDVTYTTTETTDGGSFVVAYTTDPAPIPADDYFTITATVSDASGAVLSDAVVALNADMPAHGHGMNVTPEVTDNGDGTHTGSPFLFHMSGDWRLQVAVTQGDVVETAEMYIDCCE